jgi:hypothetical protein
MMVMKKATSGTVYATLDPANKGTNATLSGGNLVLESSSGYVSARSTISKTSGKWYWEVTCTGAVNGNMFGGVGTASSNLNNFTGSTTESFGCDFESPTFYRWYNSVATSMGSFTVNVGDVIGFAFDADAGSLEYRLNNVLRGTQTGVTGTIFAHGSTLNGGINTYNFGATALFYTPPAGYNAGLYT